LLYGFDDYVLDTDRHELRRAGEVVAVEPQVFDLLAYLIGNRDRVVSQDDLLAGVWGGRIVSESTLRSRLNAARAAIGDNGQDQRLIRTLPRKGVRFVGPVREARSDADPAGEIVQNAATAAVVHEEGPPADTNASGAVTPAVSQPSHADLVASAPAIPSTAPRPRRVSGRALAVIGLAIAACLALPLAAAWLGVGPWRSTPPHSIEVFDAGAVPLVDDDARKHLASYPQRPDMKALAIAADGLFGLAEGASSTERAQQDAMQQCQRQSRRACKVYAAGMAVIWAKASVPMADPEDLRVEPLAIRLNADDVPNINPDARRVIADLFIPARGNRALALTSGRHFFVRDRPSRTEVVRLALERCGAAWQRACLLLSVDGFLTVQIPKSRRLTGIFLPSSEPDIPASDRERIAEVYRGAEWRALARSKSGWHPVAAAPSEAAAIEAALKTCAENGAECRLYAIGNFRVADER